LRFTVHRPASAEVSPCCHRPSGGDVACGVHVGVARVHATGDAVENRLALAVFRRHMPTGRASLRRVRSWNELDSPRSLVLKPGNQSSPPLAMNLAVEASFLGDVGTRALTSAARRSGHRTHIQTLDADRVEATRDLGGGLFHPVTAAIRFTGPQPSGGQLGSCPSVRTATRAGQTPLQSAQSLRLTSTKARNAQQLPGGQRRRYRHTTINTHYGAVIWSQDGLRDGGKSYVPAPRAIQSDSVRLHRLGDVAGPAESHPTDLGYPYLPIAAAEPLEVAWFESDLAKPLVPAGLTPGGATVGAIEEVPHRLGEVPQGLLLHGLRPGCQPIVFGTGRRQLSALLVVAEHLAARLPVPLLLHGQIPHKPRMATMLGQQRRLPRAGQQPKPAHVSNIGVPTDNTSKGGRRRFLPGSMPGVSTPQKSDDRFLLRGDR